MGHLGGLSGGATGLTQSVRSDAGNSSLANIAIGGTFTGQWSDTLGVVGLQVTLFTNQPCLVYVEQSSDAINVDVTDEFDYNPLLGNFGETIKAVGAYWRVRVTNVGTGIATPVRLYSVLCPVAEPLPRATNEHGSLKTALYGLADHYGNDVLASPSGHLDVNQPYRLVGTTFGAVGAVDSNFWIASNSGLGGGELSQIALAGVLTLRCGTAGAGFAQAYTFRSGRFLNMFAHRVRTRVRVPVVVVAGTTRIWGAFTYGILPAVSDGFVWELSAAGALTLRCYVGGVAVASVASGSFNGYRSQYTIDTNVHTYDLVISQGKVIFVVDGEVLHTFTPTTEPLSGTLNLPVAACCYGTGTSADLDLWAGTMVRLGRDATAPIMRYYTATAGTLAKRGPGRLQRTIVDTGNNAATITLHDTVAAPAPGNIISLVNLSANAAPVSLEYSGDFYSGLYLIVVGASAGVTVVYE